MATHSESVLLGGQKVAFVASVVSLLLYLVTIAWKFEGHFGIWWADVLNHGSFGDSMAWLLSISALFVLVVIVASEIARQRSTSVLVVGSTWSVVWILELLVLHQYIVYK